VKYLALKSKVKNLQPARILCDYVPLGLGIGIPAFSYTSGPDVLRSFEG
jgi:hypothetical protein